MKHAFSWILHIIHLLADVVCKIVEVHEEQDCENLNSEESKYHGKGKHDENQQSENSGN